MKEEKITISVNQEDVQNIINCYEKDIERIKQLEEVIKEAREYIEYHTTDHIYNGRDLVYADNLLEILSKGENNG